ncbi:nuclear transport factor 2 family protein [Kribbella sp. NPDC049174]|uniref:nuclear transport factor 2 family protein n=1 Tax=Kribbella sp. NPDC049174 TaxID=3364112 RepID=UPI003719586E
MKMFVGVGALAILLVACGQDSSTSSAPPAAGAPTTSASATPPADVLPAAQAYVDAVARRDLEGLVNAFHPDGRIVDVSRTIAGHDAIRTWARNEVIGGTLQVLKIVERRPDGQKLLVHWAPAGSDGWRAHYDFTVRGERVSVAELQYA